MARNQNIVWATVPLRFQNGANAAGFPRGQVIESDFRNCGEKQADFPLSLAGFSHFSDSPWPIRHSGAEAIARAEATVPPVAGRVERFVPGGRQCGYRVERISHGVDLVQFRRRCSLALRRCVNRRIDDLNRFKKSRRPILRLDRFQKHRVALRGESTPRRPRVATGRARARSWFP